MRRPDRRRGRLRAGPGGATLAAKRGRAAPTTRENAKRPTIATLAWLASLGAAAAQDRVTILQPDQMNAKQKKLLETIVSGPRAANYGGGAGHRGLKGRPFNAWMRSPELGMRLQA